MTEEEKDQKPRKSLQQMQIEAVKNENFGSIVCPACGCQDFRISNTWMIHGIRKRLRRCRNCAEPITTWELVVKEDDLP